MKKINLVFLAIAGLFLLSSKQAKAQFTLGITPGIFVFDALFDVQYGGGISGKFNVSPKLRVGADLGYYTTKMEKVNFSILPTTVLLEYSFNQNSFRPYAGINAGAYILKLSADGISATNAYVGGAPVLGFDYFITDKVLLNANAKIHVINFDDEIETALGFNIGVGFQF